jgi:predicted aspartyl protease
LATFRFDATVPLIRVYADAWGDTVRSVQLVLDTGASHTTFSPTAFFDIGLNPNAATRTAEVTTASNRHEVPVRTGLLRKHS